MATLYKRSNGRYYAQFFNASKHPSVKQVSLKTKHKREAEKRLTELEAAAFCPWTDKPGETKRDLDRLSRAVSAFMKSRSNLRPETIRRYRTVIGQMQQHLGERSVSTITALDLHAYLDSTDTNTVTKHSYRRAMKTFFNWLVERGVITENPTKRLRLERAPEKHPRFLTPQDVDAICEAIQAQPAKKHVVEDTCQWLIPIVRANVFLGLRAGELCNLRWGDVDFENRTLIVRNTDIFMTKAAKERTLPLCQGVLNVLVGLERRDAYVFPNYGGTKLHKEYLSRRFKHFARLVGLPEYINLHSTRHTAASWLAQQGCSIEAIRRYMGHSSISVTQKYMHLSPDGFASQIEQAFNKV